MYGSRKKNLRRAAMSLWIPLVGMLCGCPVFPEWTPISPKKFTEAGTGAMYWIYVPSYHSADREWPLIITLHGSAVWDGPYRQTLEWKGLAERHGFIVVAPNLKSAEGILPTFGWEKKLIDDERNTLAILDELVSRYNVDPKAVMLSGFSAGGYPMYWIGLRNPTRFNMLVARACNSSTEQFEKIELTDDARRLPIRLFWGKDDLNAIRKDSWKAFAWLRRHRCNAERKSILGGHLRRPAVAYQFWGPILPARYQRE